MADWKVDLVSDIAPVTCMALVSEWMHDWAEPKSPERTREVSSSHDPMPRL